MDKVRGYEDLAARTYFSVFEMNINPDWAVFVKRSKNPPCTNVNAVLSFLYTLLMYRVESAIVAEGLDSCCGNLHVLNYGKSALVYDLMEEFRTPIADSLCCSLFNLGTLKENDFEVVDSIESNDDIPKEKETIPESDFENDSEIVFEDEKSEEAIFLTKEGIKKVIAAFEEKMDSVIYYEPTINF